MTIGELWSERYRNRPSHELLSVIVVELPHDVFEQLFDTLQMMQGLTEPCAPIDHRRRHAKVQHEDDPEGDENQERRPCDQELRSGFWFQTAS